MRYSRIGPERARWGGALREDSAGSHSRAWRGKEPDSGAEAAGGRSGRVSRLGTLRRRGRARRPGGRIREAGSFVSLTREEGNRPEARGGWRGRLGTSAGSARRWRPLRGRRAEGGPGRRPGGGAPVGAGRRGLHLRTHGLLRSAWLSKAPGDERLEWLWAAAGAS